MESYELDPWREPKLAEGDVMIRSEHGRIAFNKVWIEDAVKAVAQ